MQIQIPAQAHSQPHILARIQVLVQVHNRAPVQDRRSQDETQLAEVGVEEQEQAGR